MKRILALYENNSTDQTRGGLWDYKYKLALNQLIYSNRIRKNKNCSMIYIFRGFLFGSLEEEDNRESRGYSWLLKLEIWNLEHWRNKF